MRGRDDTRGTDGAVTGEDVAAAFLQMRPLIVRICDSYLHNPHDADDAAQETFARVIARTEAITDDLGSYMRVTARNVCRDMLRRREVEQRNAGALLSRRHDDPQDVALDHRELADILPHMSRSDLRLVALRFAGFSYDEIAGRVGTSLTCVSVGLTRARQRARSLASGAITRTGGWLAFCSPWRRRGRIRALLTDHNAVLVSQCATLVTGIAILTAPPLGTAATGRAAHPSASSPIAQAVPQSETVSRASAATAGTLLDHGESSAPPPPAPSAAQPPAERPGSAPPIPLPSTQSTAFDSVVASPDYAHNHTAYASGYSGVCACAVFFVTHDAARTWTMLPAVSTWEGWGRILAVTAPDERLIVFADEVGVQISTPGGTALAITIPAAAATVAPGGHAVMLAEPAATALLRYDLDTASPAPGPTLPAHFHVDGLAYGGSPQTLLLTGYVASLDPTSSPRELLLACTDSACTPRSTLPFTTPGATLVTPSLPMDTPEVAAQSANSGPAVVSGDSGRTWHALPDGGQQRGFATFIRGGGGEPDLLVGGWQGPSFPVTRYSGLSYAPSAFGGAPFGPWPVYIVSQLPDDRLIVNFSGGTRGLLCSVDGGTAWAAQCP